MQLCVEQLPRPFDFLSLHRYNPCRYPVLLEFSAAGTAQGRWDILFIATGEFISLCSDGHVRDARGIIDTTGFIHALDAAWQAECVPPSPTLLSTPFIGGWAVLLDYELAPEVEPSLTIPLRTADSYTLATALRCPAAIVRDHRSGTQHLIVEANAAPLKSHIHADILAAQQLDRLPSWQPARQIHEQAAEQYLAMVKSAVDYVRDGDIFQANLSRLWHAEFDQPVSPAALFCQLRRYNPAPFAGLFVAQDRCVVSSSPERLVQVDADRVQTRPIAGTRLRDQYQPGYCLDAFRAHPKERAEHIMLIDLMRNDLGRICRAGTVKVDELMAIETYPHVDHLVSNVQGCLMPSTTPGSLVKAMFPGGTITGCPKVRCMQIIAELEQAPRGAYTGAMGWLGRDGNLDLNILIRSLEVESSSVYFRTGAGIVLDSSPARELLETRAKAQGIVLSLTEI